MSMITDSNHQFISLLFWGKKMRTQKLFNTITSALKYIESSIDIHSKGKQEMVIHLTWRAASELEYGLFLFSFRHPENAESLSWKLPSIKQPKIESLLASTQELLIEATQSLEADDLEEAYKKTWIAKGQLLRVHDSFEKKRKKS
jgi:hypothetical protein